MSASRVDGYPFMVRRMLREVLSAVHGLSLPSGARHYYLVLGRENASTAPDAPFSPPSPICQAVIGTKHSCTPRTTVGTRVISPRIPGF